jgi:tetratricopeptide (TPR) repeat protein
LKERDKIKEDLDFQIRFYEELIQDDQDFIDALIPLADAYTRKGWFEKGLRLDERLAGLKPSDPFILYNLSCSYALLNQEQKALDALKRALDFGYEDLDWMEEDPDLAALRKVEGYKKLVRSYFSETGNGESIS